MEAQTWLIIDREQWQSWRETTKIWTPEIFILPEINSGTLRVISRISDYKEDNAEQEQQALLSKR